MSTTPGGRPRASGIPTPGKASGIPTPGRARSTSSAAHHPATGGHDDEYISRAFADAIKANDPAQHRFSQASESSASLSPQSAHYPAQSGRRSVVGGRPSSVASSSSAVSSGAPRVSAVAAKTPGVRPPSRTSDIFARSSSRAGRTFDVGDNVRIESLGFEGVLRYLGDIDGKPGLWAGVELGGGFAGKGKNSGIVNGKQYFSCPPNCGVFVATTKLSAPTVGYGGLSRPSSVASSRNGRVTPSLSGRITPSTSTTVPNGRKTPSRPIQNGRVTPSIGNGRVTPAASNGRRTPGIPMPEMRRSVTSSYATLKTPTRVGNQPAAVETKITPGSRASKYIGMTAKQLGTRPGATSPPNKHSGAVSPTRRSTDLSSPTQANRFLPNSPARPPGSPFYTPKAGRSNIGNGLPSSGTPTKTRPTMTTPRARLPSAVAMPPPASPSTARSVSLNDPVVSIKPFPSSRESEPGSLSELELNAKSLQEKIAELMSSGRTSSSLDKSSSSRPTSSASMTSSHHALEFQTQVDRLQSRLLALEDENQRLLATVNKSEATTASQLSALSALTDERDRALSRIAEVEASLRTVERTVGERDSTIEGLERAAQQSALDVEKAKSEGDARVRDVQSKLDDKEALVKNLKELIDAKEGLQSENDAVLNAKNAEIAVLEARVHKAYVELEDERRELGGQVDELRRAGQETIALYEERLSAADSRRYEMEDQIASLEEQLRTQAHPPSPSTAARYASSAAEIDNETLREQVQHLQKKIGTLEDLLEQNQATSEQEVAAVLDRVKRYKEREENMRKEVQENHVEMELLRKSEERARLRVEEIEEALRENTVALENARADIEVLRAEIANLESIASGAVANGSSQRPDIASDRSRLLEEIAQLKQQLVEPRTGSLSDDSISALKEDLELLKSDKATMEELCEARLAELTEERKASAELRQTLEERNAEIDTMRKKHNRELPVNGHVIQQDSGKSLPTSPSKHEITSAREEIKGLKHIVQELQKENATMLQRNKVLEAENKLLLSETDQLRDDMKMLEENVEQSLLREEQALSSEEYSSPALGISDDVATLKKSLKELKVKHEAELEQLRKRQSDAEIKTARTIHDLNKEISELETLIEAKIYREDELEREIDKLKDKLARSQKKSSKTGLPEPEDPFSMSSISTAGHHQHRAAHSSTSSSLSSISSASTFTTKAGAPGEEVCEICERPGHDIFTCDLLKEDAPRSGGLGLGFGREREDQDELFCEDCEERGHVAADCPHSLDVF